MKPIYRTATAVIALASLVLLLFWYWREGGLQREGEESASSHCKRLGIEGPGEGKSIVAPDFSLAKLSGGSTSLKEFKGKVIFLNFWATWCVPCRLEMSTMEKLHREFGDRGLSVLAVNFKENGLEVGQFVDELKLTFPVLLDRDGVVSEEYGVWSLPLTYFIDRQGRSIGKVVGYRAWDGPDGKSFFEDLLQTPPLRRCASIETSRQSEVG
jgi:peroxiredoxin